MNGVGLFLWMPSEDGEKERMLGQLQVGEGAAHCGWFYPWAGDPGFFKKAGWVRSMPS